MRGERKSLNPWRCRSPAQHRSYRLCVPTSRPQRQGRSARGGGHGSNRCVAGRSYPTARPARRRRRVDESDVGDDGPGIQQVQYLCTGTRCGGMSLVDGSRNQLFYYPVPRYGDFMRYVGYILRRRPLPGTWVKRGVALENSSGNHQCGYSANLATMRTCSVCKSG